MKKLKNQLMPMLSNNKIYKLFILSAIVIILIGCKNNSSTKRETIYNIDLAVKSKKEFNSFMIDTNGSTIAIIKEIYKPDRFYKITFTNSEMDYIQKSLREIEFSKCDTINKNTSDGLQYVFYLNNKQSKREIISGTCEQQKPLDKLVRFIVETYGKKQKEEVFNGLKLIIPPSLPE